MNLTAVGVDIAKNVFQVHYVDRETGEIVNKSIKRAFSGVLRQSFALPHWHGGVWRCAPLGA